MTTITKAAQDAIEAFEAMTKGNERDSDGAWGRIVMPSNAALEKADKAAEALRAALQDKAGEVPADGWLQDGGLLYRLTDDVRVPENRDEINVTMADGSRSPESRARRAGELLDRIRASQPAPVVPDDVARDAGWFRLIRDGSGWPAVFASHDAPEPLRGDDLDAAMLAASQQKGGQ